MADIGRSGGAVRRPTGEARRSGSIGAEILLRPFGRVERDEAGTTALLILTVFFLLASYYMLKVVREPLIMAGGGAEVKTYAAAGQLVLLSVSTRAYDALASRFGRMRLIAAVYLFFAVDLVVFFLLRHTQIPLGVPFFMWVGIFNVVVVAQFWSFATDLFTQEQGERLFGIIGIGSSLGAVAGSALAGKLLIPLGPFPLMCIAALLLIVCLALFYFIDRRQLATARAGRLPFAKPLPAGSTFGLLAADRYLLLIAVATSLFTWTGTTGEYVLDRKLLEAAHALASGEHKDAMQTTAQYVGLFRAKYFGLISVGALLLQSFVVSRLMDRVGVRAALFVTPLVLVGGYAWAAVIPALPVLAVTRVAEGSLGYSLHNTARHALFLVTSREAKYKVKTAVDTFFWRVGDALAALVVGVGSVLLLRVNFFVWFNLGLVLGGLWVLRAVARLHRQRVAEPAAA